MSTLKRNFVPGNYYHIYNRGTSKQKIFLVEADKNRFTHLLYLCNGENKFQYKELSMKTIFQFSFDKGNDLVEICSWVLMDNHFHLLIFIPDESSSENISKFLARLTSSYLKYFNEKHNRTGNLFEGRFQCISIPDDYYLKYLFSYIHLNPLKLLDANWKQTGLKIPKAKIYLEDYKFSSFHVLVLQKNRYENNILTRNLKVLEISKVVNNLEKLFSTFTLDPRGSRVDDK